MLAFLSPPAPIGLITALLLPWLWGFWLLSLLTELANGGRGCVPHISDSRKATEPVACVNEVMSWDVVSPTNKSANGYSGCSQYPRDHAQPGKRMLLLGYGYFVGIYAVTWILRLWDSVGLRLEFVPIVLLLVITNLLMLWLWYRLAMRSRLNTNSNFRPMSAWRIDTSVMLISALLALIGWRLLYLGSEIWLRPLFPWDAWASWGHKTAVWFELRALVPFVAPQEWPGSSTPLVFTTPVFNYPPTIPLIQLWTLLGLGYWDDALMNMPWLLCLFALGLAIYGQARIWDIQALPAVLWVYIFTSLPLVGTHVALAGYADLWQAASNGLTFMALLQWTRKREPYQVWLGSLVALSMVQIKIEGWAWIVTLLPSLLVAIWQRITPVLWLMGSVAITIVIAYMATPIDIAIFDFGRFIWRADLLQIPGLPPLVLHQHAVFTPIMHNLFTMANWHLLWFAVVFILPAGIWVLRHNLALQNAYLAIAMAGTFIVLVFGFTSFGLWAEQATVLNRLLLHMVPGVLFLTIITWEHLHRMGGGCPHISDLCKPWAPGSLAVTSRASNIANR